MNVYARRRPGLTLSAAALLAAVPHVARAGLLTNVAYGESLSVGDDSSPPTHYVFASLDGSAVPAQRTATATLAGGTITETLGVADSGSTATYRVEFEAQTSATAGVDTLSTGADQVNDYFYGFAFTLTTPAAYTATLTSTASGALGAPGSLEARAYLFNTERLLFQMGPDGTASGTLAPGEPYGLNNNFGVANGYTPQTPAGTASYEFTLTLTAVPEPATAGVLAVAAAAGLLGRRRRPRASR